VITLVYGLGFGMVLVLLLVPALIAVQHDLRRRRQALRRMLGVRSRPLRAGAWAVVALLLAWLGATLGVTAVTGALPAPVLAALPMAAGLAPMTAALAVYAAGALALLAGVALAAIIAWLALRRQPAGQP
jgi:hypothetical protein